MRKTRTRFWRNPDNSTAMAMKRQLSLLLHSRLPAQLIAKVTQGSIRTSGLVIDTNAPCVSDKTRASLFWGTYESAEMRLIAASPPTAGVVVDLGASLGVVSAAVARHLDPGSLMVCVEANRELLDSAAKNVAANAPHIRVETVHGAIDYNTPPGGPVEFDLSPHHVASSIRTEHTKAVGFQAPSVRLRDIVPPEAIFALIADVEGAEVGMLLDEAEVLQRCCRLVIEVHAVNVRGHDWTCDQILDLVAGLGFVKIDHYGNSSSWRRDVVEVQSKK